MNDISAEPFVYQPALVWAPRSMYPNPLAAFFFPDWGFFGKARRSAPDLVGPRPREAARHPSHRLEGAAAASALAGQFQRALEIDPMQAAALARLWRQAPR